MMNELQAKELCLALMQADTEEEVVRLLKGEPARHALNPDYVRNLGKARG